MIYINSENGHVESYSNGTLFDLCADAYGIMKSVSLQIAKHDKAAFCVLIGEYLSFLNKLDLENPVDPEGSDTLGIDLGELRRQQGENEGGGEDG